MRNGKVQQGSLRQIHAMPAWIEMPCQLLSNRSGVPIEFDLGHRNLRSPQNYLRSLRQPFPHKAGAQDVMAVHYLLRGSQGAPTAQQGAPSEPSSG